MRAILLLFSFFNIAIVSAQTVEATINPIEMFVGEQAQVTVTATMKEGSETVFPVFQRSQLLVPGVEVLKSEELGTRSKEDGYVERSVVYTLTSFYDTLYYLPPFEVSIDGKSYKSKALALKVLTVEVDTLHPENFFGPKGIQENPFEWKEWKSPFWLSVLMLVLMVVGYYFYLRLRDNKPIIKSISFVKRILPHQRAMKEIETLRAEHRPSEENQESLKQYYTRLTETLRKYIEERYGFSAMEMTSSEIIEHLTQSPDAKSLDELRHLFQTADLVKFAKYSTLINENDANLMNAIEFINETKIEDQQAVEVVKPQFTEEEQRSKKARTILKCVVGAIAVVCTVLLVYVVYNVFMLLI